VAMTRANILKLLQVLTKSFSQLSRSNSAQSKAVLLLIPTGLKMIFYVEKSCWETSTDTYIRANQTQVHKIWLGADSGSSDSPDSSDEVRV
jgi:hypothetical protein